MQVAVRPFTTGIALVGASVIAVSPITVKPSEIQVQARTASTAAVELMASPIDFYTQLLERTIGNGQALVETFLANPAPILKQVLINQAANVQALITELVNAGEGVATALTEQLPALLQTAFSDLASGNVEGALNALLSVPLTIALPLVNVLGAVIVPIQEAVANFNNVVQNVLPLTILAAGIALAGPALSTVGAVGSAIQGVIDAVGTGDPIELVNALVNAPGVIADGLLNGGYGPQFFPIVPNPGILEATGGPIAFVLALRTAIAQALGAPAPLPPEPSIAEVDAAATTLADQVTSTAPTAAFSATLDVAGVGTDDASAEAGTTTDPEPDAAPAAESDEEDEEGAGDTTAETEDGDEDESDPETGATDLAGGNKVEPGDTVNDNTATQNRGTDTDTDTDDTATGTDSDGGTNTGRTGVGDNTGGDNTGGGSDGDD